MTEQLSEHFTRAEFACPVSGLCRVSNRLLGALEQLRKIAGNRAIYVSRGGGCRSWAYNEDLVQRKGASPRSEHLVEEKKAHAGGFELKPRDCRAADIHIEGLTVPQMYYLAEQVPDFRDEGGVGVYPQNGFVHVDVRGHRARWMWKDEQDGKGGQALGIPEDFGEDPFAGNYITGEEEQTAVGEVEELLSRVRMASALIVNGSDELGAVIARLERMQ